MSDLFDQLSEKFKLGPDSARAPGVLPKFMKRQAKELGVSIVKVRVTMVEVLNQRYPNIDWSEVIHKKPAKQPKVKKYVDHNYLYEMARDRRQVLEHEASMCRQLIDRQDRLENCKRLERIERELEETRYAETRYLVAKLEADAKYEIEYWKRHPDKKPPGF
jgi:hypothetical protein